MMTAEPGFLARIEADTGEGFVPCGTGFLIAPQYVLTCAHVALGIDAERWARWVEEDCQPTPPLLNLRFGDERSAEDCRGTVVEYFVPDMALIRLDQPVSRKPVRLITNIRERHEDAIEQRGAFVLGFASFGRDQLIESRIDRIVCSARTSATGRLLDLQVEGGRAKGMSGSPMLIQVSDEWACLGMLYLGGEGAATSRLMLADTLLEAIAEQAIDYPPPLNADDCLACSNDAAGNALRRLGEDHRQGFLRYGNSAGRLSGSDEPISLASVYVHRDSQEHRIKSLFKIYSLRRTGMWVSIQGPAGTGKTSLLWYLHNLFSEDQSTAVQPFAAQYMSEDCGQERALMEESLSQRPSRSRIVVIDTLDLIVGRGDKSFLSFLTWLHRQNTLIITTCRPLEAQRLASMQIPDHVVPLGRYTPEEAQTAVERYVEMAYQHLAPTQRAVRRNDLWNLLDGRRKVQELSFDPLILRMMFEAYPPDPVPLEINTSLIYTAYWERCVVRDRLKPSTGESERLREVTACCLAHAILFRETTAFDDAIKRTEIEAAWRNFDRHAGAFPWNAFESLLSSSVIEPAGGLGTIRFFHQTLLEFAAARHILQAPAALQQACLDRILSDLRQGVFFRSPVLVQMAVQDAQAGGNTWRRLLKVLLEIGSEAACYLSLEIFGKIPEVSFCSSILAEWKDRHLIRLAECAVDTVSYYPKPRIPFGLTILEALLETDEQHVLFALCAQRLAGIDPPGVLDFLRRTLPLVTNHAVADENVRGHYKTALLACFDSGCPTALTILAAVFTHLNAGQQQGALVSLANKMSPESAEAIAEFLVQVKGILYGGRASDTIEDFLGVLSRLHAVAPNLSQSVAAEILNGGQPSRVDDHARLRGGVAGGILKTAETIPEALRNITGGDHLQRLTAAATLAHSGPSDHGGIIEAFLSFDLRSLNKAVRASLFEVAGCLENAPPEMLLRFITDCPWPENAAGKAWRKITGRLALVSPYGLKNWLFSRVDGDRALTRMTAVGLSQILKSDPGIFTEPEVSQIFELVLKSDINCRRIFAERTGAIACVAPALASRIVAEFIRPRHCEVWPGLADSLRACMSQNPDWVFLHMPALINAAQKRTDHGLFSRLLEALRLWPEDQRTALIRLMEDHLTAQALALFPQEKCQVEFLVLVKLIARYAPERAFSLLERSVVTTDGAAGAAAIAAANIAAHTDDGKILDDVLDQMLRVAPRGHQRNARNAIYRGLRSIDEKLGCRRVIGRFFAMYSEIQDGEALKPLIRAVHNLESWTAEDKARLLADTQNITGKIRSYIMNLE